MKVDHPRRHRAACLRLVLALLAVWFFVSLGCGVLFRDWLDMNMPNIGTAPFGFWMAQQGSIITFLLILVVYAWGMNKLDKKHGYTEED
ncbi:DUF4212 domain-containing protein [Rubritalea spongiae]|uniref:DUF4212 domain-containing protein n=1 Tax=Rubritalea spongiae TaxID=430797 RepID=A0ABW5E3X9_9BACT